MLAFPSVLSVEITSVCNLKCKMCALTSGDTRSSRLASHMDDGVWARIVEAAAEIGFLNVNGWGENFSNPRFLSYLRQLDELGVSTNFSTNGTFVTSAVVEQLATLENLTHINVSIDSPDPRIYESIRGLRLEPAIRGLRALLEGLPRPERVTVSSVVMKENIQSLADFPRLLHSIGARAYCLQGLVDPEESLREMRLDDGTTASETISGLFAECEALGIAIVVHPLLQHWLEKTETAIWSKLPENAREDFAASGAPATKQCGSPWDHVFVNRDGLVMPCCNCPAWEQKANGGRGVMGDLRRQSFAEVWRGERFGQFRRDLLEGDVPAVCRTCDVVSTGPHFYRIYSARLVEDACRVAGTSVHLEFENTGLATWTEKTKLRLGTARPRGRASGWQHSSWLSGHRPAELNEPRVPPGSRGRFDFVVNSDERHLPSSRSESFQLLAEDVCWIPGTEVKLQRPQNGSGSLHLSAG